MLLEILLLNFISFFKILFIVEVFKIEYHFQMLYALPYNNINNILNFVGSLGMFVKI